MIWQLQLIHPYLMTLTSTLNFLEKLHLNRLMKVKQICLQKPLSNIYSKDKLKDKKKQRKILIVELLKRENLDLMCIKY
jgi:hypothetical protein